MTNQMTVQYRVSLFSKVLIIGTVLICYVTPVVTASASKSYTDKDHGVSTNNNRFRGHRFLTKQHPQEKQQTQQHQKQEHQQQNQLQLQHQHQRQHHQQQQHQKQPKQVQVQKQLQKQNIRVGKSSHLLQSIENIDKEKVFTVLYAGSVVSTPTENVTSSSLSVSQTLKKNSLSKSFLSPQSSVSGPLVSSNMKHDGPVSSSIQEYLDSVHKMANEIVFFQWNSSGILQRISSYEHQYHKMWIPEAIVMKSYQQTKPSKYGSAAMVLNTDTIRGINFTTTPPPIPLLVYTIPKNVSSSMFQVIPNPYDYKGNSERQVTHIQKFVYGDPSKINNNNNNNNNNNSDSTNDNIGAISLEAFRKRRNTIVWRGAVRNQEQRVRLIEMGSNPVINGMSWLDIADTYGSNSKNGLSLEGMSLNYRYQIDVGGVSGTAWNGLRWKMCSSGGLVFKVDSFAKDWWHDELVPWEHYIPVKDDLSDLQKQYEWVERNIERAYEIALAGRTICLQSYKQIHAEKALMDVIYRIPSIPNQWLIDELNQIFEQN